MILLQADYGGLVIMILAIMFAPPVVLVLIGFAIRKKYKSAAKVCYILGTIYLIISLGICGSMLA